MPQHYFLSRLMGSGTAIDPFRPIVSTYGSFAMLDLRPDETRLEGWCFASVDVAIGITPQSTSEALYLSDNARVDLPDSTLTQIKESLGITFGSTTLAEILAEILLFRLMPGRGLGPGLDGSYTIHLGNLLWEATEVAAYEFVGRLREPQLLTAFPNDTSSRINDLRASLNEALTSIAAIVDYEEPGWLANEIEKLKRNRSHHPLALNYSETEQLLHDSDFSRIHGSSAALWIFMLAHDLRLTSHQLTVQRLSPRLRNPSDCEPTKYELYIMARYLESGALIEKTDSHRTGEFRVLQGDQSVHIECKYKSKDSMEPRRVKEVFETALNRFEQLFETMDQKIFLQISCRTDPTQDDIAPLLDCTRQALEYGVGAGGLQIQCGGKFQISLLLSELFTTDSGLILPTGMDYATTGPSTLKEDSAGIPRPTPTWGIAWRVERPGGLIRSVVDSVRKAANQVPSDSPNLIYVHVPPGSLGVVHTRIDSVVPEIEHLLSNPERYTRVNAVLLTGQANLKSPTFPRMVSTRFIYKTIANKTPRKSLPLAFRVFGRDFTRKSPTSSNPETHPVTP